MKLVLCLSGGLDSAVLAATLGREASFAITVNYGQRQWARELHAAQTLARWYTLPHRVLTLSPELWSVREPPQGVAYGHAAQRSTVVPNRNMMLLSLALAQAIRLGLDGVALGIQSGEADPDNPIYPDCRPPFITAMQAAAATCHEVPLVIRAPFVTLTKCEVLLRGQALGVPFEWAWSCYREGPLHCGQCGACLKRRAAFTYAGVHDSTEYAA